MDKYTDITFRIEIKILDEWIADNYKLGSSGTAFYLIQINNKLWLIEGELTEKWL